jgi:predicted metal-dependent HD superfamily phosphohydrolase
VECLDVDGAVAWALDRLRTDLSPDLIYHNLWHTEHDVIPAARRLAHHSDRSKEESDLLQVAAAFHDVGFVEVYEGHEQRGAQMAGEVLPRHGFSAQQVAAVQGMILATALPQSPQNSLEALLADADLDVLGRDDFFERNQALREELLLRGEEIPLEEWYAAQLRFLQEHSYFTPAARALRLATKEANMARLKQLLKA